MRPSLLAIGVKRSRPGRTLIVLGLVAGVMALLLWFSARTTVNEDTGARPAPSATTDPLGAALVRCNDLGSAALDDAACKRAWAESRRRFLGRSDAQPTGPTAHIDAPAPETR
jgi:conjugative transfer region protein TrbK